MNPFSPENIIRTHVQTLQKTGDDAARLGALATWLLTPKVDFQIEKVAVDGQILLYNPTWAEQTPENDIIKAIHNMKTIDGKPWFDPSIHNNDPNMTKTLQMIDYFKVNYQDKSVQDNYFQNLLDGIVPPEYVIFSIFTLFNNFDIRTFILKDCNIFWCKFVDKYKQYIM